MTIASTSPHQPSDPAQNREASRASSTQSPIGVDRAVAEQPHNPFDRCRPGSPADSQLLAPLLESVQKVIATLLTTLKELFNRMSELLGSLTEKGSESRTRGTRTAADEPADQSNGKTAVGRPVLSGTGGTLPRSGEFLWKPRSDKDGRLAILLPTTLSDTVEAVEIVSPGGRVLGTGLYADKGNGDREHYRFPKEGGSYPDGSVVRIVLKDGFKEVPIENTANRVVV